jgi:hydroxypyruvate reductase
MDDKDISQMRADAREIFNAGVEAVEAAAAVYRHCRMDGSSLVVDTVTYNLSDYERIWVIGAGKAGASMAGAIEQLLGEAVTDGVVSVKYGHVKPLTRIRCMEGGHPVPDEAGEAAARAILETAVGANERDLVICLISGGGSALLPLPVEGVSLSDKQETTKVLLACGAAIHEINTIRKHISVVKGGGLARAVHPARLLTLILSDVVGDDLDVIASGPTVPDTSGFDDCMRVFDKYGIVDKVPTSVRRHIERGADGEIPDTPKPGDAVFDGVHNVIVGSNGECVSVAAEKARALGYNTMVLSTMLEGETADVAKVHGGIVKEILRSGQPVVPPACLLSGGETTVTLRGDGLGGRNQEFVLAAAVELAGINGVVVLSGGTDGTDGPTDAAGAIADGRTCDRAQGLGLVPHRHLAGNNAYPFFEELGDLIKTGPTNTNVMDLRVVLVG